MEKTAKQKVFKPYQKWVVFICLFLLAFMANGMVYQIYNLLMSQIVVDCGWDAGQQASVSSVYSLGLIIAVLFGGFLLDKLIPKYVLGIAGILCGIFTLLRGMTTDYSSWIVLMILFGVANGIIIPSTNKMVGMWFPPSKMTIMISYIVMAPAIGQALANLLGVPITMALGGWMNTMKFMGILYAIFGLLMILLTKSRRSVDAATASVKIQKSEDMKASKIFGQIFRVPEFWIILIYNTIYIGIMYCGSAYAVFALANDTRWGLDLGTIGALVSPATFMSMIMYFVAPIIYKKVFGYKNHRLVAGIFLALQPFVYIVGFCSFSIPLLLFGMILQGIVSGFAAPAAGTFWMQLPEVGGARIGTVMGIATCLERLVAMILTGVVGTIIGTAAVTTGHCAQYIAYVWCFVWLAVPFFFILHFRYRKRYPYLFGKEGKPYKELSQYQKAMAEKEGREAVDILS